MTSQDHIDENAKRGYIYVGMDSEGQPLWKKFDGISTVYYLDRGYEEVLSVWSTFTDKSVLELILNDLKK